MEVFILRVFLQVCEQLAHVERRWFLVTAIMEEMKQLQKLAEYPSWFGFMIMLTCTASVCSMFYIQHAVVPINLMITQP